MTKKGKANGSYFAVSHDRDACGILAGRGPKSKENVPKVGIATV